MNMRNTERISTHRQQGAVLIVAMLLLLVLTMLGVLGLSNMTLEERMANGYQQMETAFDASQSTINAAILNASRWGPTGQDCRTAGNCATLYQNNTDATYIIGKGLSDNRNRAVDANNCYFDYHDTNINSIDTGTVLTHGAVNSAVYVTSAGKASSRETPGFETAEGSGVAMMAGQLFDITSVTNYSSSGITTATSSQTQRILQISAAAGTDCNRVDFSTRTYPLFP